MRSMFLHALVGCTVLLGLMSTANASDSLAGMEALLAANRVEEALNLGRKCLGTPTSRPNEATSASTESKISSLDAFGALEVLECASMPSEDESHQMPHCAPEIWAEWQAGVDRLRARVFAFGEGLTLPTLSHLPLHGVLLSSTDNGTTLVLDQDPFSCDSDTSCHIGDHVITGPGARERAVRRGRIERLSGLRNDILTALARAGSVTAGEAAEARDRARFRAGEAVESCALDAAAMEEGDLPCAHNHRRQLKTNPRYSLGHRRVFVGRFLFNEDAESLAPDKDTVAATVRESTQLITEWSWGQVTWNTTMSLATPFRMGVSRAVAGANSNTIYEAAKAAAISAGINPDNFDHFVMWLPSFEVGWSGLASVSGFKLWMNNCASCSYVLIHEFGHNLGLNHANIRRVDGALHEYGDDHDVMGVGGKLGHFQSGYKHGMQWYSDSLSQNIDSGPQATFLASTARTKPVRLAPSDAKLTVQHPTPAAMVTEEETMPALSIQGHGRTSTGGDTFYVSHISAKSDRRGRSVVHSLNNANNMGPSFLSIPSGNNPKTAGLDGVDAMIYQHVPGSTPAPKPAIAVQQLGESVHHVAGLNGTTTLFPSAAAIEAARTTGQNIMHLRVGEMDGAGEARAEGRGYSHVYGAEMTMASVTTSITDCPASRSVSVNLTPSQSLAVFRIAPASGSATVTIPICGFPSGTTVAMHAEKPAAAVALGANPTTGALESMGSDLCLGDSFPRAMTVVVPEGAKRFVVISTNATTASIDVTLSCSRTPPCINSTISISGTQKVHAGTYALSASPASVDGRPVFVRSDGRRFLFYSKTKNGWGFSNSLTGTFFRIGGPDAMTPVDLNGIYFYGTLVIRCQCPQTSVKTNGVCAPCQGGKVMLESTCVCPPGKTEVSGSCTACEMGKYKFETGNQACTSCAGGKTTAGTGATACVNTAAVVGSETVFYCDTYELKGFGSLDGTYKRLKELQDGVPAYARTTGTRFMRRIYGSRWIISPDALGESFFRVFSTASPPQYWKAKNVLTGSQFAACVCATSNFTAGSTASGEPAGPCQCPAGEFANSATGLCSKCGAGTYRASVFDSETSCTTCPRDRSMMTTGGDELSDCSLSECSRYEVTVPSDSAMSGTYTRKCMGGESGCESTVPTYMSYLSPTGHTLYRWWSNWRLDDDDRTGNGWKYQASASDGTMPSTITSMTSSAGGAAATVTSVCTGCAAPFYYDAATAANDDGPCQFCPAGTETVTALQGREGCVCSAGYGGTGPDGCQFCSAATKKAAAGNTACEACPATFVASADRTACVCAAGFAAQGGVCVDVDECASMSCSHRCETTSNMGKCTCPPGMALNGTQCVVCGTGLASSGWSQTCKTCPVGSSADAQSLECMCQPLFHPVVSGGALIRCEPPRTVRIILSKAAPGAETPVGTIDGTRGADRAASAFVSRGAAASSAIAETAAVVGTYEYVRPGEYQSGTKWLCERTLDRTWVVAQGSCGAGAALYALRPNVTSMPLAVSGWRVYHHGSRGFDPEPLLSLVGSVSVTAAGEDGLGRHAAWAGEASIAVVSTPSALRSSDTTLRVKIRGPLGPSDRVATLRVAGGATADTIKAACARLSATIGMGSGTIAGASYVVTTAGAAAVANISHAMVADISTTLVSGSVASVPLSLPVPAASSGLTAVAVCVQPVSLGRGGAFTGAVARSLIPFAAAMERGVAVVGADEALVTFPSPLVIGKTVATIVWSPSVSAGDKLLLKVVDGTAICSAACASTAAVDAWATATAAGTAVVESAIGDAVSAALKNGTSVWMAGEMVETRKMPSAVVATGLHLSGTGSTACLCMERSGTKKALTAVGGRHTNGQSGGRVRVLGASDVGGSGGTSGGDGSGTGTADSTCPAGQYQSAAATSTTARVCTVCRSACSLGTEEETSTCSPTTDRVCRALPPAEDQVGQGRRGRVKVRLVIRAPSSSSVPPSLLASLRRVVAAIAGVPENAVFIKVVSRPNGRRLLVASVSLEAVIDTTPAAGTPTSAAVVSSVASVTPQALAARVDADLVTVGQPTLATMGVAVQQTSVQEATSETGTVMVANGTTLAFPEPTPNNETQASNAALVVGLLAAVAVLSAAAVGYWYTRRQERKAKPVRPGYSVRSPAKDADQDPTESTPAPSAGPPMKDLEGQRMQC